MLTRLIRQWLARRNPARELALMGHQQYRNAVKAKARQLCEEAGRPVPPALR